jgi:hypothetical protein
LFYLASQNKMRIAGVGRSGPGPILPSAPVPRRDSIREIFADELDLTPRLPLADGWDGSDSGTVVKNVEHCIRTDGRTDERTQPQRTPGAAAPLTPTGDTRDLTFDKQLRAVGTLPAVLTTTFDQLFDRGKTPKYVAVYMHWTVGL